MDSNISLDYKSKILFIAGKLRPKSLSNRLHWSGKSILKIQFWLGWSFLDSNTVSLRCFLQRHISKYFY